MIENVSSLIINDHHAIDQGLSDMSKILSDYIETGGVKEGHKYFKDTSSVAHAEITLIIHTMFFVLLHEYGHIINGHLDCVLYNSQDDFKDSDFIYTLEKHHVPVIFKNVNQEFDADIWAANSIFSFSRLVNSNSERPVELAAPALFLGVAMLIESAYRLKGVQIEKHPPAFDRIDVIDMVFETLGAGKVDVIRNFIGHCIIHVHNTLYGHVAIASVMTKELYESIQRFINNLITTQRDNL